jgi:hypothetical protein
MRVRTGIVVVWRGFGLAQFEFGLAEFGGFGGIGSGGDVGLLEEVAPALVVVGGALRFLESLQCRFCFLPAAYYRNHSGRTVSSDVVEDDGEGSVGVVGCQKESACTVNRIAPLFIFYDAGALSR